MLCRTSRGKAGGRELEGFVATSVSGAQRRNGAALNAAEADGKLEVLTRTQVSSLERRECTQLCILCLHMERWSMLAARSHLFTEHSTSH